VRFEVTVSSGGQLSLHSTRASTPESERMVAELPSDPFGMPWIPGRVGCRTSDPEPCPGAI
jgi:hypothetical protein